MPTTGEFVVVASYETVIQAETLRGVLAENGIRAFLTDAETTTSGMLGGPAVGVVGLQVAHADASQALEVLRDHEAAVRQASGDEALVDDDEPDTACIACGVAIPMYLDRCPACGWSYS